METDILIIGGGLSGLATADRLNHAGHRVTLLEARDRPGGRILTRHTEQSGYDLGPAWIWPQNHRIRALAERFGLDVFAQHADGNLVFEDPGGAVRRDLGFATMGGALRIADGLGQITDKLAAALPPGALRLSHRVTQLAAASDAILATGTTAEGPFELRADRVILALPPRIIAQTLRFTPALDSTLSDRLSRVPTWMAGHAKLVAVYDQPFWRAEGLSGDAISHRGPLVEIHDASLPGTSEGALFGFLAPAIASADFKTVRDAGVAQLTRLFGPAAGTPRAVLLKDWAQDPETATRDDRAAATGHPSYGPIPPLTGDWRGRVSFAGTETAETDGGFLEGALQAAEASIAAVGPATTSVAP
ncbi:MAG: FAD-dependent oxidoreductase [Rhodobacteraceae bacterium]|nr:FAD-dependent oxidoreductase [Paracoccaceae bacterium]